MVTPSLEHLAGQLVVAGFEGLMPPRAIREALAAGHLGGVMLFRRNVATLAQLIRSTEAVHGSTPSGSPPFVAVDQEGGRAVQLRGGQLTPLPSARRLGATEDTARAEAVGRVIATEIAALGLNVNFAPVLDVDSNPDNPVIGDRSLGADPEVVARLGRAVIRGHLAAGVIPCGKHFPGHGDTATDSHETLPEVDCDLAQLRERELIPFAAAIRGGLPMVMTAHIRYPDLDPTHPATLSPRALGLLRDELGFGGVVITDDIEMAALADHYRLEEIVARGVAAGVDVFLVCHTPDKPARVHAALVALGAASEQGRARLKASYKRVRRLKQKLLQPGPWQPDREAFARLGCDAHRAAVAGLV